ncbi:acyltransferase [Brachybacterium sp. GCM10030252]|uniref:acyltransferase family protein n=1 Tax=Brachybacterium sp. GCM10030252 TaxID=3273380 RepID=UPI003615FE32
MAIAPAPQSRTAPSRTAPSRTAPHRPAGRAWGRDAGIDLVRAICVLVIVVLHSLQVGVTLAPAGPVLEYATVGAAWYPPLTWLLQVMPIFFVIGGFAGMHGYRRMRERGGTATGFVVGRVHRLLVPAVVTIAVAGVALAVLTSAGVPADLVALTGIRYGQPLWFLGVFLAVQAVLPALLTAHQRAPLATLAGLVTGAVLIDALRLATAIEAIGYTNLAFVWLALQQAGFFLADGRIDALRPRTRALGGLVAAALAAGTIAAGIFSPDLVANMNPPTTVLLLVGAAQIAVLSLLRGPITALSRRPRVAALTAFVTQRAMTIYLWNLTVLLAMAAVTAFVAAAAELSLPEPSSAGWWLTRPVWIALAIVLTAGVARLLGGIERLPLPQAPTTSASRAAQAVLIGLTGVLVLLVAGTTALTATTAIVLIVLALSRLRRTDEAETEPPRPARREMAPWGRSQHTARSTTGSVHVASPAHREPRLRRRRRGEGRRGIPASPRRTDPRRGGLRVFRRHADGRSADLVRPGAVP